MTTTLGIATFAIAIVAAIAIGLLIRNGGRNEPRDRRPAPSLLERMEAAERARGRPQRGPLIDTYDGAVRLQRATKAAEEELRGTGNWEPADVDQLTRAIVAAWIGEDEPQMVSVPIMKLGDIKHDAAKAQALIDRDARRLKLINESRARSDLPPLVTLDPIHTGGMVEPGKPYIVGEIPSETVIPLHKRPKRGDDL